MIPFFSKFFRGWTVGLHECASNRTKFHAIRVAILVLAKKLPRNYTSKATIVHRFQNEDHPSEALISEIGTVKATVEDRVSFWPADERGYEYNVTNLENGFYIKWTITFSEILEPQKILKSRPQRQAGNLHYRLSWMNPVRIVGSSSLV